MAVSELPSGMEWRLLGAEDIEMVRALTADCLAVDGGLPFAASTPFFEEKFVPLWQGTGIGGFLKDGSLMACAGVQLSSEADEVWADTIGMVHPDYRGRKVGGSLLGWSITEARTLFAGAHGERAKTLYLQSEFLTEPAAHLFAKNGFLLDHANDVMRRDLFLAIPEPNFPEGITLAEWSDDTAALFFQAYDAAFRDRPGFPGWSAEFWIARATEDEDFSPEHSLVAYTGAQPIGFITCFKYWIGQVGVRPEWRKQGLGRALVAEVMQRVAKAGGQAVWLDVNLNNPGAARVYSRLGFDFAGRRGTYTLTLT